MPKKIAALNLDKIRVEVVTDYFERADVETLLSRHHPLGANKAIGERLCYSASYQGEWVAVLMVDGAVKRNKLRESRIGWSNEQRDSRLIFVVNNSRFLIAPKYAGEKNLASKVLSLLANRISEDWRKRYGHPILAIETYVDTENTGVCYMAAGWENLGYSSGYQAYGQERTHSKWYFLKALHRDSFAALRAEIPHALCTGVKEVSGESNNNYVLDASKFKIKDLQKALGSVIDPRGKQGQRYQFIPLLSLCIAAVISGYTQYRQIADWIESLPPRERALFGLPGDRIPDETTIGFLLRQIEPVTLQKVLRDWLLKTYNKDVNFDILTLDGKALRATSSIVNEQSAFLNVFANELGIVIEHLPTAKGGGEKKTARKAVRSNNEFEGKIVLADAINTDRQLVEELKKKVPRTFSLSKAIRSL